MLPPDGAGPRRRDRRGGRPRASLEGRPAAPGDEPGAARPGARRRSADGKRPGARVVQAPAAFQGGAELRTTTQGDPASEAMNGRNVPILLKSQISRAAVFSRDDVRIELSSQSTSQTRCGGVTGAVPDLGSPPRPRVAFRLSDKKFLWNWHDGGFFNRISPEPVAGSSRPCYGVPARGWRTMDNASDRLQAGDQSYFLQGWQTYCKVRDFGYLCHRDVYDALHRVLTEDAARPFRFVDVGCGDSLRTAGRRCAAPRSAVTLASTCRGRCLTWPEPRWPRLDVRSRSWRATIGSRSRTGRTRSTWSGSVSPCTTWNHTKSSRSCGKCAGFFPPAGCSSSGSQRRCPARIASGG